jgi:hypothetical protein
VLPSAATLSLSHAVMSLSARAARDLDHQRRLAGVVEVNQLHELRSARHQDEPRIIGVVHQQHARERQVAERDALLRKPRIEREGGFVGHRKILRRELYFPAEN